LTVADLGTIVPAGASGGALLAVIWYLLRANASDRRDYQDAVDRAIARADAMALRVAAAEASLDEERQRRRRLEDLAAEDLRELRDARMAALRTIAQEASPRDG
jgi:hypothetical protein